MCSITSAVPAMYQFLELGAAAPTANMPLLTPKTLASPAAVENVKSVAMSQMPAVKKVRKYEGTRSLARLRCPSASKARSIKYWSCEKRMAMVEVTSGATRTRTVGSKKRPDAMAVVGVYPREGGLKKEKRSVVTKRLKQVGDGVGKCVTRRI